MVPSSEWLTLRGAVKVGKSNTHRIMKESLLGNVRFLAVAGEGLRFAREDVERLAEERQPEAVAV